MIIPDLHIKHMLTARSVLSLMATASVFFAGIPMSAFMMEIFDYLN
jgi:hypothetical protein